MTSDEFLPALFLLLVLLPVLLLLLHCRPDSIDHLEHCTIGSDPEEQKLKTVDEIKPNYGPVYAAAMYPGLAEIFQRHGYALAVHGSLARDFDLIAVPWTEIVSPVPTVLKEMTETYAVRIIDGIPTLKNHGRLAYTISVGFGECAIDLSFLPSSDLRPPTSSQ